MAAQPKAKKPGIGIRRRASMNQDSGRWRHTPFVARLDESADEAGDDHDFV